MARKPPIIAGGFDLMSATSVRSGRRVSPICFVQLRVQVMLPMSTLLLTESIQTFEPDVVWPLVHGSIGVTDPRSPSESVWASSSSHRRQCRRCWHPTSLPPCLVSPPASPRPLGDALSSVSWRLHPGRPEARCLSSVVIKPTDGGSALALHRAQRGSAAEPWSTPSPTASDSWSSSASIWAGRRPCPSSTCGWTCRALPVEISTDGVDTTTTRATTDETEYFVPARQRDSADSGGRRRGARDTQLGATCPASTSSSTTRARAGSLMPTWRRE